MRGAGAEAERRLATAIRRCRRSWSTTSRCSASRPGSCATPSSPSGAAPCAPPTGTGASGAVAVVYGHLHIPRTTWHDGVRFEEVSLGYPRERASRRRPDAPRRILPEACACLSGSCRRASPCGATRRRLDGGAVPRGGGGRSGRAVEKRRREFTTARACAREALAQLGSRPSRSRPGRRGEPHWPAGDRRQHHPLRRLPRLRRRPRGRADRRSGSTPSPTRRCPTGCSATSPCPRSASCCASSPRAAPGDALGPTALQHQGVGLQGLVSAGRALARLRRRHGRDRFRERRASRRGCWCPARSSTGASCAASAAAGWLPTG